MQIEPKKTTGATTMSSSSRIAKATRPAKRTRATRSAIRNFGAIIGVGPLQSQKLSDLRRLSRSGGVEYPGNGGGPPGGRPAVRRDRFEGRSPDEPRIN